MKLMRFNLAKKIKKEVNILLTNQIFKIYQFFKKNLNQKIQTFKCLYLFQK
jgi:hypothetical protein